MLKENISEHTAALLTHLTGITDLSNNLSRKQRSDRRAVLNAFACVFIPQCPSVSFSLLLVPRLVWSLKVWRCPRQQLSLKECSPRPHSSAAEDGSC